MNTTFAVAMSNSSRPGQLFQAAIKACRNHFERRRALAQIRQLDDHMLRQFGLNRVVVELQ